MKNIKVISEHSCKHSRILLEMNLNNTISSHLRIADGFKHHVEIKLDIVFPYDNRITAAAEGAIDDSIIALYVYLHGVTYYRWKSDI